MNYFRYQIDVANITVSVALSAAVASHQSLVGSHSRQAVVASIAAAHIAANLAQQPIIGGQHESVQQFGQQHAQLASKCHADAIVFIEHEHTVQIRFRIECIAFAYDIEQRWLAGNSRQRAQLHAPESIEPNGLRQCEIGGQRRQL